MANSSAVARLLADVVSEERLHVVLNGTTGLGRAVEPAADYLPGSRSCSRSATSSSAKGCAN